MPCCKAEEFGSWCKDVPLVDYQDEQGNEYCIFHASKGKKGVSAGEFSYELMKRINSTGKKETCDLSGAVFEGKTIFKQFNQDNPLPPVSFYRVVFHEEAVFRKTVFSGETSFHKAEFLDRVTFSGARFTKTADFRNALFSGWVSFDGTVFESDASFFEAMFSKTVFFQAVFHRKAERPCSATKPISTRPYSAAAPTSPKPEQTTSNPSSPPL